MGDECILGCTAVESSKKEIHPHREIIEDICSDSGRGYCILAEALSSKTGRVMVGCSSCKDDCELKREILSQPLSDYMLEQVKCVEKFKWERNKSDSSDMGWNSAWKLWVKEGYHARYREVYRDGMKHKELFSRVVGAA